MISKLLIASALLAFASASCPNDCSQHGVCNQFSACVCYRNWMGADCSERVCPFGHAFIDTPQGDLNADGRVDRANVKIFTITSTLAYCSDDASPDQTTCEDAGEVWSDSVTFPSNVLLFPSSMNDDAPNDLLALGTTVASTKSTNNGGTYQWEVPVVVHDNQDPDLTSSVTLNCALVTDVNDGSHNIRTCDGILNAGYGVCSDGVSTDQATCEAIPETWTAPDDWNLVSTASDSYTYQTQFTNSKTWELYPANHGKGKPSETLTKYWDEAHFYAECSGKGTCNRDSGECECYPGFTGAGCARTSCPNECSGHGVCSRFTDLSSTYTAWDRNKTQACVCDAGYQGIDCSQRVCPSGDDPITRNSDPPSGASVEFVNSPHAGGQEAEIQTFGRLFSADSGNFALEFTDEFGDKWVTQTLDWDASASDVESALEALPNSVIQDVIVHESTANVVYETSTSSYLTSEFKSWTVTFISNSGNIPSLGVRYSFVGTINSFSKTESDNAGAFRTLGRCGANEGCVAGIGAADGVVTNDVFTAAVGVCSFRDCATDGESEPTLTSGDLALANEFRIAVDYEDQAKVDVLNVVFHTTGRPGSQENSVCSNRGLCDYSSGLCKCFNGFTDDDCSRQNALAMY